MGWYDNYKVFGTMSVTQLMMAIFIFIKKGTYKNILL